MSDGTSARSAPPGRRTRGLLLLLAVTAVCTAIDIAIVALDSEPQDYHAYQSTIFLSALAVALSVPRIELPRGYLTLAAISLNAGALVLNPRYAAIVGVVAGLSTGLLHRRFVSVRLLQVVTVTTGPICASVTRVHANTVGNTWIAYGLALAVATSAPILLTGVVGSVVGPESLLAILRRNLSRHWVGAFVYFGLASVVIGQLLDGSVRGYALATLVALLALALSDSVAGRQIRLRLQAQLTDAERIVAYSRVVEGTIHNLRNHLGAASGHLDEIATPTMSALDSRHVVVATAALDDAIELLDQLQAGHADPRQRSATELLGTVHDSCLLLRNRIDRKRIDLTVRSSESRIVVFSDPLLVKQVIANLLLNSIDAVGRDGRIDIEVVRGAGEVTIAVSDNGPGVAEEHRSRLFEPHFTTKATGNGIGLYVSYRIAVQLGGDIRYDDNAPIGAVFTFVLPASSPGEQLGLQSGSVLQSSPQRQV